jgi:glutathione synthase/RimK-type ligase-like ATP-grasp enzyme
MGHENGPLFIIGLCRKYQMTVCIVSNVNDAHAILVEQALQKKGEKVVNWYWADFPTVDRLSAKVSADGKLDLPFLNGDLGNASVWVHRGLQPIVPQYIHPADVDFVKNESLELLTGILMEFSSRTFCVNPISAIRKTRPKICQLMLAAKCGLKIPPSLYSNDPVAVRTFFNDNAGEIVVKHASQMHWESSENNKKFMTYTSKIFSHQISNDNQLSSCPSIFQKHVKKDFEIRVVFFGKTIFAIKIDSQSGLESIDWRKDYNSAPPCSIFELPQRELSKIVAFIEGSGLLYGSIDLVVDKYGEYIFLEVNESGQFLWIEHLLPDLPLLDCFSEFLIQRDPCFKYRQGVNSVMCREFGEHVSRDAIEVRTAGHIKPENYARISE